MRLWYYFEHTILSRRFSVLKISIGLGLNSKAITQLVMKLITVIGGIAVTICFFFAIIFGIAASVQATASRLFVSVILFAVGIAVIAVVWYLNRRPKTIVQRLELSGQMKATSIRCPNCGGSIEASQIKITQGVPYVKCPYCGITFEVTEEPKW